MLAEFFEIHDGLWHHGRVERERIRVTAKQLSNSKQAKLAAARRWGKPELLLPGMMRAAAMLRSNADALPRRCRFTFTFRTRVIKNLYSRGKSF